MDVEPQPGEREELRGANSDLERRFRVALVLSVVLAALAWFTIGEGKILVMGKPVEMRLVPLVVIGGMVLRTVLARHAEKIRKEAENGSS